jgi:hypothetical protein
MAPMLIEKGNDMSYNKLTWELQAYGMTEADIREEYMNGITAKFSGLEMVVMGILSDAQHMQETEYFTKDHIRKQLNIAKFILSEMMDAKQPA